MAHSSQGRRDLLVDAIEKAKLGRVVDVAVPVPDAAAAANVTVSTSAASPTDTDSSSAPQHEHKRLRIMDEFPDESSEGDVFATVAQYLSPSEKPSEDERADPLLYWKNSRYKVLASLARTYLTASASSVPCEAMFSITGIMLNGRRSSLAPHTFNRLIFIHDNGPLAL